MPQIRIVNYETHYIALRESLRKEGYKDLPEAAPCEGTKDEMLKEEELYKQELLKRERLQAFTHLARAYAIAKFLCAEKKDLWEEEKGALLAKIVKVKQLGWDFLVAKNPGFAPTEQTFNYHNKQMPPGQANDAKKFLLVCLKEGEKDHSVAFDRARTAEQFWNFLERNSIKGTLVEFVAGAGLSFDPNPWDGEEQKKTLQKYWTKFSQEGGFPKDLYKSFPKKTRKELQDKYDQELALLYSTDKAGRPAIQHLTLCIELWTAIEGLRPPKPALSPYHKEESLIARMWEKMFTWSGQEIKPPPTTRLNEIPTNLESELTRRTVMIHNCFKANQNNPKWADWEEELTLLYTLLNTLKGLPQ